MPMMPKSFMVTPTLLLGDTKFEFTEGALPDHQSEHNTQPYATFFFGKLVGQMHVSDFSAFTAFTCRENTNKHTVSQHFIAFHNPSA